MRTKKIARTVTRFSGRFISDENLQGKYAKTTDFMIHSPNSLHFVSHKGTKDTDSLANFIFFVLPQVPQLGWRLQKNGGVVYNGNTIKSRYYQDDERRQKTRHQRW